MSIIVKGEEQKKFKLPEAGTVRAVCCAVYDVGIQATPFVDSDGNPKYQHKCIIAWELEEKISEPGNEFDGMPYMLSKSYTCSLNEKATLRKDLESWRGKAFTDEEINAGIDLEKLLGVNCLLGVTHVEKNGKVYANITAILPLPKGAEKIAAVRAKDEKPPRWVADMIEKQVKNPTDAETDAGF